mgnify:CR=1 FL=1
MVHVRVAMQTLSDMCFSVVDRWTVCAKNSSRAWSLHVCRMFKSSIIGQLRLKKGEDCICVYVCFNLYIVGQLLVEELELSMCFV